MRKQRAMQTMVEPAAMLGQQQQISTLPIGTLPCKTAITALIQEDFITFSCPKYSYPTVHHFHCRYVLGRHVRYIVLSQSYPAHSLKTGPPGFILLWRANVSHFFIKVQQISKQNCQAVTSPKKQTDKFVFLS